MGIVNLRPPGSPVTVPCLLEIEKPGRITINSRYHKGLIEEIRQMKGRRYHGYDKIPRKVWSVKDCDRNRFTLSYLAGQNPYEIYDQPLVEVHPHRDCLREHQHRMLAHVCTRRQCLLTAEWGLGKTLVAIEAMEFFGHAHYVWVGTSSALAAVRLEFEKWGCQVNPQLLTYRKFTTLVEADELETPGGIVFDECQKLKGHNTAVSLAADKLTEAMRRDRGTDALILLMSGSPAPHSPCDWWHLAEVACPGYLREGSWWQERDRLAFLEEGVSASGQKFKKPKGWRDDENKCHHCGKLKEEHDTQAVLYGTGDGHTFKKSTNEIAFLHKRLLGLNANYTKEECTDLPEIQYRRMPLPQTPMCKKAERLIIKSSPRVATALIKLRQLSDGFQYQQKDSGERIECEVCFGEGVYTDYDPDPTDKDNWIETEGTCPCCDGQGTVPKLERTAFEMGSPKDQLLRDLLEEYEDVKRFIVYAGFSASIDRCRAIALEQGWDAIVADGRGWNYYYEGELYEGDWSKEQMLTLFQDTQRFSRKTVFIGQPGAAGTGLTLTASPAMFMYSNTFNFDDRIQAINRGHRLGMDMNRGFLVIDCLHLDIDSFVLDNLEQKEDLLKMTMGVLRDAYKQATERQETVS